MEVPTFTDAMSQPGPGELPSARVSTSAPADAFGGPSQAAVGQAAMGMTKDMIDAAKEQKDRADQIAHIQADTQASQLQTDIQMKVAKMKGENALGAPDFMQQAWKDGVSKIQSGLNGSNQQMAFAHTSAQRYDDLNKSVQLHVSSEYQNFEDQTTQAGINQFQNHAVVNAGDDHLVAQDVDGQKQLIDGWAERKGIPQDSQIYKDKLTTETSATHLGVIKQRLQSGLDDGAQAYYNSNKDSMSAKDVEQAENVLDASKVMGEANDIYKEIQGGAAGKGFKFSDGTINGEAVRKYVMDQTDGDMSDQRTLKVLGQVKAQMAEYNRDQYHKQSANERDFVNQVISIRQNGGTLQDAQRQAIQWGHDPYDTAQKMDFAAKTFEPPAATKAIIHEQLREGIQDGTVELADLDRAMNKGNINAEDWASLRQQKLKAAADGTDPMMKNTNNYINSTAVATFGNDRQAIADYKYAIEKKSQGKSPDEKMAIAKQELENVPKDHFWQIFGTDRKYKQDFEQAQGQSTAQGAMYQDIGFKQAQAISSGMTGVDFQRDPNPEAHVQAFANTLGVKYEDLKVGQPANNAIESIRAHGKVVTPELVRKVLKKYPDGKAQ